ncbi:hypothetical protein A2631_04735 [Candidatus Daviesbacteria bacterium RIFCSPHIGHO2_01_FULL_44_29]|uniref:Uncharacterized protein n=1 Tax=Candidatus Daviesbacteria bacterium RIFCSPHIGHO2_02_FULL_43_12 TaxID=1797776 RepID=A0A1F5KGH1_9BACT|nr:MAG: hypothetical protein A2631_04735 [Candidatus Daviesbacteria bacterium RIFCSPHIGHO2_01_FULL_44_29]OGE40027.1 MAG: hypothetical protein A3D25_04465 [Candidatus Daviesbacteria bacterium RIFCSPHIGHO2_02_FULL_43_12]OGE41490.1 MAG: hypothetical protein A3E86_05345 [Candidatus Daviesbacteria bacterium RIFCSPHIGHO2_12_FULL_47_45]OGE70292.1 MAG: hypothetical protein A3B55_01105 [Candidatus Daviesbacteria bacterium RIFCSPLOWO2_01_FULL_43_15]
MRVLKNFLLVVISLISFLLVIWRVPAPNSWTEASIWQIVIFMIPLLALIFSLIYLILKKFTVCFLISLGVLLTLVLKIIDQLSWLTGILTWMIFTLLLVYFFKQRLTSDKRIPKLSTSEGSRRE